jgi:hypothetical protein
MEADGDKKGGDTHGGDKGDGGEGGGSGLTLTHVCEALILKHGAEKAKLGLLRSFARACKNIESKANGVDTKEVQARLDEEIEQLEEQVAPPPSHCDDGQVVSRKGKRGAAMMSARTTGGMLNKATRYKYRQELKNQQRRRANKFIGVPLTDEEWNVRFKALYDELPFLTTGERYESKKQLSEFRKAALVSGRTMTVPWPPPRIGE